MEIKMNEYLKNVNRVEFVVTMACSGKCIHCSQGSHISNERINGDIAAQAVKHICSRFKIESLMTFGGEPLLFPETVCKIHKAALKCEIPRRDLITNGYSARTRAE